MVKVAFFVENNNNNDNRPPTPMSGGAIQLRRSLPNTTYESILIEMAVMRRRNPTCDPLSIVMTV
eukprot:CAMPEP_0168722722 /NCGR_PEP_ID=MMETSP0724-20121128/2743_1 /TAXON_ID=265536 /ORGANISM="Amphiprora sp., Strain CCMP467" /LENGTH=64 /DNA_ID=CAMNT_0008769401 /DNA_START=422 /DNA_END=616 /DNA_ORIENTATION=-